MWAAERRYNRHSRREAARTLLWRSGVRALMRDAFLATMTRLGREATVEACAHGAGPRPFPRG